jgi:hypothetical protein
LNGNITNSAQKFFNRNRSIVGWALPTITGFNGAENSSITEHLMIFPEPIDLLSNALKSSWWAVPTLRIDFSIKERPGILTKEPCLNMRQGSFRFHVILAEATAYIVRSLLLSRLSEYLGSFVELHHLTQIHKCSEVGNPSSLLHTVSHNQDCYPFL